MLRSLALSLHARHVALTGLLVGFPTVLASPPGWWSWGNPSVLDPSAPVQNNGVAVVGQAKFMADRALQVLTIIDSGLADDIRADLTQPQPRLTPPFGMLGPVVDFEVPSPKTSTWSEAQHAVLTVGQLKAISAPFYKHIHAAVPTWIDRESTNPELKGQLQLNGTKDAADATNFYPWTIATGDDANRAPATVGQLKAVFSLRLETLDLDENGISDYDPDEDYDGDGISNGDEFDLGTNPILADTDSNEIEVYRINKTSVQQSLNPMRPSHPGANWIRFTGDWSPPPAAVLLSPTPTIPVGNVGTITASQLTFPDTLPAGTPSYSYSGADPIYVGMGVYGSYDVMIAGATMYDDDIPGVYSSSALERPRLWMKLPAGMQSENARKIPYLFVSESEDWLFDNHQYGPPTPMTVFDSFVVEFEFEAGSRVSKPLDVETELTGGTPGTLTSCRYRLHPVELRDIKDHADIGDDVTITDWNTAQNIADNNIAWIEAHISAIDAAPRMPQLELRVPGLPEALTIEAKLNVQYTRGNGARTGRNQPEDQVRIPANGNFAQVNGDTWEIYNQADWQAELTERGFFGGEATLTYQIKNGANIVAGPEEINFRIGGRNSDDARCRAYIESRPSAGPQGNLWFAYAIARSESSDYNGEGSRYNQFLELPTHRRDVGRPLWNDDGVTLPGGYGMFQVTGSAADGTANIPRKEIWNWQENVHAGLAILASKRAEADIWMPRQKNADNANGVALPNHTVGGITFAEGANRTMTDAVTIKLFNGASRPPANFVDNGNVLGFLLDTQGSGHYCYWRNASNEWALNRFNNPPAPIQPFNYVDRVCSEVED